MRDATCKALVELAKSRPFVFLTGDLGFKALEPLQQAMGERFINAGVAEQNMISVAAGIASTGQQAWAYSIAPFLYARPFEQIRNDICQQDADVKLVGNGGGYGYGPMGSTHHALEDYGTLLALRNIRAYVPAFAEDVSVMIPKMAGIRHPAYLRLGRDEKPAGFALPPYAAWRRLLAGSRGVLLAIGPLAGTLLPPLLKLGEDARPELWVLSELPLESAPVPAEFLESIRRCQHLCVVEEHVQQGSVGQMLAHWLLSTGQGVRRFEHLSARGYPSGDYGSQAFHRKECGLDPESILKQMEAKAI